MIAACFAPALAIAFYRCLLAAGATLGWMTLTSRRVRPPAGVLAAAGPGLALAGHFVAWIPSLRLTSVALSTAMIATQPVWSALLARIAGVRQARAVWWGITVSVLGVLILTGLTGTPTTSDWVGMGLALVAAILAAVYVAFGEALRTATDLGSYTTVVYGIAAAAVFVGCLLGSVRLGGYPVRDWLLILAITLVAQLGGHSALNAVVHRTSATVVSTAILFEAPGATILAAVFLGQSVGASLVLGLLVMLVGLVIVVRGAAPQRPESGV